MAREIVVDREPDREPTHPGEILREDTLPALKITKKDAAETLGIARSYFYRLLNGEAPVSPEMALKIEKAFKVNAGLLLRLQNAHDGWRAAPGRRRARWRRAPAGRA